MVLPPGLADATSLGNIVVLTHSGGTGGRSDTLSRRMMATMARFFGRNAGLWATALFGIVTVGPLAVFFPTSAAFVIGSLGCLGAGTALARASGLKARCEKLSQEVDVLSQRLVKAEQNGSPRSEAAQPDPLRAEVHELTVEIGLLSGIVRDLSAVIRSQDDEIAGLKAQAKAVPLPAPVPQPPPVPEPRVELRPEPKPETRPESAVITTPPLAPPPLVERAWTPPVLERMPDVLAVEASEPQPIPARRPIPPRPPEPPRGPDEAAILAAFDRERLEVYLQPVVTLPQRKVVAYEAAARLRIDEEALEASHYLPALERHGRTTELDRRMLAQVGSIVRHLARRGSDARVTYGLSPLSLFEPGFLKEIGQTTGDGQDLAGLEIALPQASWRGLDNGQRALLAALRGRIGFCLDRPTDLRFDARELAEHGIGQVKVPAELLLHPATARGNLSDLAVEDLAPALARARIRFVVSHVTSEADVPDLIDLNVPFAQGSALAPARPVRGEILASLPPEAPPPSPPADDPGTERRSFRSLLRRAG